MIKDIFLNEISKSINGEAFLRPQAVVFSEENTISGAITTTLVTGIRTTNQTSFGATRVGSSPSKTIKSLHLTSAESGGEVLIDVLTPSLLHTSSYDLQVNWLIEVRK